jgi:site-specific DNA-methyltransferase (adenine-specific)
LLPPSKDEKTLGSHPTQKPLTLLERIIMAASDEGDLVLDPFVGSGTTGVAAAKLRRRFIGVDADQSFVELTAERYRQL